MKLHPDEPWVVGIFDDLRQHAVRRQAADPEAALLELVAIMNIDLETVAVAFLDLGFIVVFGADAAAVEQCRRIGADAHGAAEVAALTAAFDLVAAGPIR